MSGTAGRLSFVSVSVSLINIFGCDTYLYTTKRIFEDKSVAPLPLPPAKNINDLIMLLGSVANHNDDGNEKVRKQKV